MKTTKKRSENTKGLARELVESIGKGKKVSVMSLAPKYGLSKGYANSGNIQKTKSFKEEIEPVIERYKRLREKIMAGMESKDMAKEKLMDLHNSLRTIDGQINTLEGRGGNNPIIIFEDRKYYAIIGREAGNNMRSEPEKAD